MATALYADVHVPGPVILQLRLRGVNIAAATEAGHERKTDEELLDISTASSRVMVTQDIRFRVLAEDWQRTGSSFCRFGFRPSEEGQFW
jgi:predicted nuclease of predicted toxin-antitoxin system